MRAVDYIKDRLLFLVSYLILFIIVLGMMVTSNMGFGIIFLVFIIWFGPLTLYIIIEFIKIKNYYNELISVNDELDKKYLISEVMKEPEFIEGKIIHHILKESNRDMQEHVKYYKNMQNEYQEYIETWVHEIKTPLASTMLIIENNEDTIPQNMKHELKKVEDYIEQVLYYSRSNDVSNDYIVKKFSLEKSVRNVIRKNANDIISKKIAIDIENVKGEAHTDPKWVEFIINQIIGNTVKYSISQNAKLTIFTVENENSTTLTIKDNGVGISERDIDRVFEKGFTGENGRRFGKSTGIGLYLCKKLCNKLGLGINIMSKQNEGTEVTIIFPIGNIKDISNLKNYQ